MITTRTMSLSLVGLLFAFGAVVKAGDCSVKSIQGSFGFVEQGTVIVSSTVMLPYASSGLATFDGNGHLSGKVTSRIGGMVHNDTFTGTYSVDADCTFSIDFTGSLGDPHHQVGTITGEGIFQEGRYVYTDANLVATGTAKRSSSGR